MGLDQSEFYPIGSEKWPHEETPQGLGSRGSATNGQELEDQKLAHDIGTSKRVKGSHDESIVPISGDAIPRDASIE